MKCALGNWEGFTQKTSGTTELNQSRSVNEVNEITNITETTGPSWVTPVYDRNGNMTTAPKPADPTVGFTCTYDAWNRMVKVEEGTTTVGEYAYDAINRRVTKDVDSTVRHFLYSSQWQSLEERLDSSSVSERQHVWGRQYVDQLILRDRDTSDPANGTLDERLYALQDANWNVTTLVDNNGLAKERRIYEPYGVARFTGSDFSDSTDGFNISFAFTGQLLDAESSIYHFRHRYYLAQLGKFLSKDPPRRVNRLNYPHNSPICFVDPSGLSGVPGTFFGGEIDFFVIAFGVSSVWCCRGNVRVRMDFLKVCLGWGLGASVQGGVVDLNKKIGGCTN